MWLHGCILLNKVGKDMFGYIKPNKMELRLKEIHRYGDLYCGLCHALRTDYGQAYGCVLSYDITFLLMILNGLSDDEETRIFRCPINPFKKKTVYVSENAVRYSAFINYFLAYLKIEDDVVDDNTLWKKILQKILEKNKKYVKQYRVFSDIAEELKRKMLVFNAAEKEEIEFDELTNLFGNFFAQIFMSFFSEEHIFESREALEKLCFNLGKWIYLIDAYDDYLKDIKEGKFNLIQTMCFANEVPSQEEIHQRVKGIMVILVGNMKRSLKDLTLKHDYEIIENVVEYGCNSQYMRVIEKRYPEYYTKIFPDNECCNCVKE